MNTWNQVSNPETVVQTQAALKNHLIESVFVNTKAEAKAKVLELLPKGAEVMTMTSETLEILGLAKHINESGDYNAVKPKLYASDRATQGRQMQQMGAAPEWAVGSVHAVTQDGKVVIVSNTGSQLPAYVYGADHVVWVVGTQKIVPTLAEAMTRIEEYVLPLESARAHKAYGVEKSNISKVLIVNNEVVPGRVTIVFVGEALGF